MLRGAALLLFLTTALAAHSEPGKAWDSLPPLPDEIGYSGMFAGVSYGTLFAGGGSQFRGGPPWAGGTRYVSRDVFVLHTPSGPWQQLHDALPTPVANAAAASYRDEVIVAGGADTAEALSTVYRIRLDGDRLQTRSLPTLPRPLVYASGAVVGDTFYVIGGLTGLTSTSPSAECWALPLAEEKASWQRLPDLPGPARFIATAASDKQSLYIFGGLGFTTSEKSKPTPIPLRDAYRYDLATRCWHRLADLPEARIGSCSPTKSIAQGTFLIVGGYAKVHSGPPQDHPGFPPDTFLYNIAHDAWSVGPSLPQSLNTPHSLATISSPQPMIAAPAALWRDSLVIVSGEVRPGIRTPSVLSLPLSER